MNICISWFNWLINWNQLVSVSLYTRPNAWMHQQATISLVQTMFCRMFGAKPLSEPLQAPESKLISFTSGHAFRAFDPHTPVTWSQNMISWLSSMMAWHGCPLPEPRYLLLCKGCPAKFRHTSHKCEKQMGQKPYTLKFTQVCVKTFKP